MALKTFRAAAFAAKTFAAQALAGTKQLLASLGAWGGNLVIRKPKKDEDKLVIAPEAIPEAIPESVTSRIQSELLAATLAAEVIERAKQQAKRRKNQQIAILLTL